MATFSKEPHPREDTVKSNILALRMLVAKMLDALRAMRRTMYSKTDEESVMADAAIAAAERELATVPGLPTGGAT